MYTTSPVFKKINENETLRSPGSLLFLMMTVLIFIAPVMTSTAAKPQKGENINEKVLMAIFAHPDDETLVAPILNKYINEGVEVILVTVTDGRLGVTDFSGYIAGDELAEARREELKCAADILGIELIHLDYEDQLRTSEGFDGFIAQSRGILTDLHRIISDRNPDAIITFGPDGFSNHIDHRIIGDSVTQVILSQEWENTPALFYVGLPASSLDEANRLFQGVHDDYLTVQVPYSDQNSEKALQAALCHETQFKAEDVRRWWGERQSDTVYLRPFEAPKSQSGDIFNYQSQY